MKYVRYSADWHDDALNAAPEERATVADFQLFVDDKNVCVHMRDDEVFNHVTIAVYPIANGLAHDWWTLFGGRDRHVSLMRHRSGYIMPNVVLSFDGAAFEVSAQQREYKDNNVRFWAGPNEVMDRACAEISLSSFIETVIERLDERKVWDSGLAQRWRRVLASRQDADEQAFCEAAGALGRDPYAMDDAAADTIEQAGRFFEGEPLSEFLAGARSADHRRLLEWVAETRQRPREHSLLPDLKALAAAASKAAPAQEMEKSWSLGYRRARAARAAMHMKSSQKFLGYKKLAKALGASAYEPAANVDGIRLLRCDSSENVHLHLRGHGESAGETAHLFTLARGVGDAVCFPDARSAPVNDLRFAYRQAAGRAFAAEFLAPLHEIQAMHADGRDPMTIANEFCVMPTLIERQLENADRIAAACD